MLQPIEAYQKVALVSLEEAVESIVFCCSDIRRRIFIAVFNCKKPVDGLNQNRFTFTRWNGNQEKNVFITFSMQHFELKIDRNSNLGFSI
jgi:hypothetical protein